MTLGDLIARFDDETSAAEALLSFGDLRFVATLRRRAAAEGIGPGTLMTRAVRRYVTEASDAEWITLMGELNGSSDPGLAFVRRALNSTEVPA
jgi:hypothetical protein